MFGWDREALEGVTPASRAWREQVDPWWSARLGIPGLTPRWALQHVGTEVMRNAFHQDIWTASMQRRLHAANDVVVSDVRFANEADAIRAAGGVLVRVSRPGTVAGTHATEALSAAIDVDYELENAGTIEHLETLVRFLVTKL